MNSQTVLTKLDQITKQSTGGPDFVFKTLAHHLDVEFLSEAFRRLKRKAAYGIDKVTWQDYKENLQENLQDLHERLKAKQYRATPSRRVWINKDDGKRRGLGIPVIEDKIVQKAVAMILEAVYEPIFKNFSYGFRPKRNAHQAIALLRDQCLRLNINWIIDADISGYFDNIDHKMLIELIRRRMNDGSIIRLIGKWLKVGIMEDGSVTISEKGTPQGGVISPIFSNIFLHYVLDEWFEAVIKPRFGNNCCLIRFADDFVIGFTYKTDAERVFDVLPKRFAKYGLEIHPKKSKLVQFSKPAGKTGKGPGTFDFLSFTFYWQKTRKGYWTITKKTKRKSQTKALTAIWDWCKENRHMDIHDQYKKLCAKLRGHYNYFGVIGNYKCIAKFHFHTVCSWKKWLSDRCHKGYVNWVQMGRYLKAFPLPKPRIMHQC